MTGKTIDYEGAMALLNKPFTDMDKDRNARATKLDYYNLGLWGQSYSRSLVLHRCPRKMHLSTAYKLRPDRASTTFAYGHAVGAGLQSIFKGLSMERCVLAAIAAYDYPMDRCEDDKTVRDGKTVWNAIQMVERIYGLYSSGSFSYLDGWELAWFDTEVDGQIVPIAGIELTFVIDLGPAPVEGQRRTYEGHIDLVLFNPSLNRYMIVELKTTSSSRVDKASYQNSAQALGYGVVLDSIAHNLAATASFDVLYMVVKSGTQEIVPFPFTKTHLDKAEWLNGIMSDTMTIDQYHADNWWPARGEACNDFFKPCEYIDMCHYSHDELKAMEVSTTQDSVVFSQMMEPTYFFDINDLLERQAQLAEFLTTAQGTDVQLILAQNTLR